jgi:hypothetical protein
MDLMMREFFSPQTLVSQGFEEKSGGEGGIRTHGTREGTPHFECGTFNHSATSP